jgi:APA family basic amino acid/polyamine antiporter
MSRAVPAGTLADGQARVMLQETSSLVRAIGRWSLAALMLNTIIGASIFGLPSLLAAHLGRFSPAGYFVTAVGIAAIAACLAEVASQFREAGGPYLYARAAFGPFVAIQIGWLTWLTRILASAAAADLFVSYLTQFFPTVEGWALRTMVLGLLIGFLAVANYLGVTSGTRLEQLLHDYKIACRCVLHRRRINSPPAESRRSCHSASDVRYEGGLARSCPVND